MTTFENKQQRDAAQGVASRDVLFSTPNGPGAAQIGCDKNQRAYTVPAPVIPVRAPPPQYAYGYPMHDYGPELWRVWVVIARIMAELVGCFFIGWAIGIRDIWVSNGAGDPGAIAQSAVRALVTLGVIFPMMVFHAGHFNPLFTLIDWMCHPCRWHLETIGIYLGYWLGQFLGFLLAALFVHGGVGGPSLLSCTIIKPSFGNGFGFLYEWVGLTALGLIFALAVHRKGSNLLGVVGLVAADFALVAAFQPATGGSLNLFRSIGVALVEGGACGNSLGMYVGALFAAAATDLLLLYFIFSARCLPKAEPAEMHGHKSVIMMHQQMTQMQPQQQQQQQPAQEGKMQQEMKKE